MGVIAADFLQNPIEVSHSKFPLSNRAQTWSLSLEWRDTITGLTGVNRLGNQMNFGQMFCRYSILMK